MKLIKTFIIFFACILTSFISFSQISVDQELRGRVAGLTVFTQTGTPGAPSYIRIRGNGSLLGNNRPLFILDGVPYENYVIGANSRFPGLDLLSLINTLDIESVAVLKNAKDVAPYGVKGANGVIVITTKKGVKQGPTLKDLLVDMEILK
tara:strand:- start:477 stop:926 length:450 start_codon:yes stop_codon:yes gene_type:complete